MNIDKSKCIGCHTCQGVCPMSAISTTDDGKSLIDLSSCINCKTCASVCPVGAIITE